MSYNTKMAFKIQAMQLRSQGGQPRWGNRMGLFAEKGQMPSDKPKKSAMHKK